MNSGSVYAETSAGWAEVTIADRVVMYGYHGAKSVEEDDDGNGWGFGFYADDGIDPDYPELFTEDEWNALDVRLHFAIKAQGVELPTEPPEE